MPWTKMKIEWFKPFGVYKNVTFTSPTGNEVNFDEHGSKKPKYNIYNYQVLSSCQKCSKSSEIVNVGYQNENLQKYCFYNNF